MSVAIWKIRSTLNKLRSLLSARKATNHPSKDPSLQPSQSMCLNTHSRQLRNSWNQPQTRDKQMKTENKILNFLKNKLLKSYLKTHHRRHSRSLTKTTQFWERRCSEIASMKHCLMAYLKGKEINNWSEKTSHNSEKKTLKDTLDSLQTSKISRRLSENQVNILPT